MGIGYIFGCLVSILLWKFDRQHYFLKVNKVISRFLKNKILIHVFYILFIFIISYLFSLMNHRELSNFLTAFIVIDISNTERENLIKRAKVHFYDSISTISRALVCGFVAPLFFILCFGNMFGILYMLIYNINLSIDDSPVFKSIYYALSIIPCVITEIPLFIIYTGRNKKLAVKYKGDYLINSILRPILNVDILAAYIESVNFNYYYSNKGVDYLKNYGDYKNNIDEKSIKDYLSVAYGICLVAFIVFFIIIFRTAK